MGQRNSWGSQRLQQKNIYNDPLEVCSLDPITGWYRDGYARTDNNDRGLHVVCATMTQEVRLSKNLILNSLKNCVFFFQFLDYTKGMGNDLSTPRPWFPGLKPGKIFKHATIFSKPVLYAMHIAQLQISLLI